MNRLEATILVDAPPEVVWNYIQDYDRRGEWDTRVKGAEKLTDGPLGAGSRVRYRFRGAFWMEAEYIVYKPGRQSAVKFDRVSWLSPFRTAAGTWQLTPEGKGTRFTTRFSYELKWGWFGRFLDRVHAEKAARRETRESLHHLKQRLESIHETEKEEAPAETEA